MRVIAGSARGRLLRGPDSPATRPTSDVVRGAIFSMLDAEAYRRGFEPDEEGRFALGVAWPRVLDLYAGTGAFGVEALSRGALYADLVDQHGHACRVAQANLVSTRLDAQGIVHCTQVSQALTRLPGPYDLVFADPPYDETGAVEHLARALARPGLLAPSAVGILEQRSTAPEIESVGPFTVLRSRRHGGTRVSLLGLPQPVALMGEA